MTWHQVLAYCLAKPGAWQDDRDTADEWLRRYPDDATVMPYIGRPGWNSLQTSGAIPRIGPPADGCPRSDNAKGNRPTPL
jgi:hypothetical protein